MLGPSRAVIPASSSTSQKSAILRLMSWSRWRSVRHSRMSGWMPMARRSRTLCCVGLVFSSPAALAQLPDGLDERQALDVADGAADFDEDDVDVLGDRLDRVLDRVGDVRDDLHRAPEVVAAALLLDHLQVDLARRPVVVARG